MQLVLAKKDRAWADCLLGLARDARVQAVIEKAPRPVKRPLSHPLHRRVRFKAASQPAAAVTVVKGTVTHYNYARRGTANAVLLASSTPGRGCAGAA